MCGIIGVIGAAGGPVYAEEIERQLSLLGHRGPDGGGMIRGPRFAFGHRRLAVIDPGPAADQPMTDGGGRLHLTYNGEIYNYRELRDELAALGHRFGTASDTEVLLAAYREWGIAALLKLEGMFAFALYDEVANVGYLVRDRLGIKPVFHTRVAGGGVAFCSELPGLLDLPGVGRRLNPRAVSSYLSYRHVVGPETYFEGIHRVEPGSYIRLDRFGVTARRYWNVDLGRQPRIHSPEEATEALRAALGHSVRQHLVADVPVGLFLSGGVDSSILLHEANRSAQSPIRCFTARVPGGAYDEVETAAATARTFGSPHEVIDLEPGTLLGDARRLICLRGEPLGMHNEVAMYHLACAVRRHAKVVLCGEGADELFAGYGRIFRLSFDWRRLNACRFLPTGLGKRAMAAAGIDDLGGAATPFEAFMRRYGYFSLEEKQALFTPAVRTAIDGDRALFDVFAQPFAAAGHRGVFDQVALAMVTHHLPGLLQMVDGTTMAAGVEGRVPFLDHRIVQLAFDMSPDLRLRWRGAGAALTALLQPVARFSERADTPKFALRHAWRDTLPDAVLHGRKMGFPVPLGTWLLGIHGSMIERLLTGTGAAIHDLLDRDRLKAWFEAGRQHPDDTFGRKVWLLTNLEFFLQEHF
jgi:asparagine synthase (glutamine-hydrolysing)